MQTAYTPTSDMFAQMGIEVDGECDIPQSWKLARARNLLSGLEAMCDCYDETYYAKLNAQHEYAVSIGAHSVALKLKEAIDGDFDGQALEQFDCEVLTIGRKYLNLVEKECW